jgi:flagella basal body P-ring formation protein FlgA
MKTGRTCLILMGLLLWLPAGLWAQEAVPGAAPGTVPAAPVPAPSTPAPAPDQPGSPAGLFRTEAAVAGEYITLGHLANLTPDLTQRFGQALIWTAPAPGQVYTLTKEFLLYRLTQLGIQGIFEPESVPAAIQVRQTGVLLSLEQLSEAFRRSIQSRSHLPGGEFKIQVYPLEEAVVLPDHQVSLEVLPPKHGRTLGEVTLETVVMRQGQPLKRLKVTGMVRLERQVVCAARALQPAEVVGPQDVQLCRRDVTEFTNQDLFTSPAQVIGRVLARKLGFQEIVTGGHLSNQPVIKRGEEVTVLLDHDGLTISTKGVAKEEGHQGRAIRMLNPKSKKEFLAEVVDSKTVQVRL